MYVVKGSGRGAVLGSVKVHPSSEFIAG
jgi:hypothetical protein